MPKGKSTAQPTLVAQLLPVLPKPSSAIGMFVEIQGCDWGGCPASDKDKWFKCIVRQFEAVHEFPGKTKSAGFQVQEMGESGEGSLEPGVASGDVFWILYPNPFLKHFYKANPDRLPDGHRDKPETALTTTAAAAPDAAAGSPPPGEGTSTVATPSGLPKLKQDALVYSFFSLESDELCGKAGPHHGKRQQQWKCIVDHGGVPCGAKRTLTCDAPTRTPPNSNLTSHIREEAKKCPNHAAACTAQRVEQESSSLG